MITTFTPIFISTFEFTIKNSIDIYIHKTVFIPLINIFNNEERFEVYNCGTHVHTKLSFISHKTANEYIFIERPSRIS